MSFIIGLGGERKYCIGRVNYVVSGSFLPSSEKVGLADRVARVIESDFTDWTEEPKSNNIDAEYVCSTVGKED